MLAALMLHESHMHKDYAAVLGTFARVHDEHSCGVIKVVVG